MNNKVCRACFSLLKTKHYVPFNNESDIPGCTTVQDAVAEILPNLNFGAVIEPILCISCLMVIKTAVKFKQTCMNNEQKLLQYLEDMETTKVCLKMVVDREELTDVISSEHDYIRRYKTNRNLLTEEIKASALNKVEETAVVASDGASNDVMLQFNSNDTIDSYTEFSNDILKLFWDEEESTMSVKVEMTEENVEPPVVDLKCMLNQENRSNDLGYINIEQQGAEECTDVKIWLDTLSENHEIEFLESELESVVEKTEDNNNMSVESDTTQAVPNEEDETNPAIITCTICNLKFEGYKQAALHGKNVHGGVRMIYCKLCRKIFYTTRAYYVHNTTHGFKLGDEQGRLPRKLVQKREPKSDPELCAYCGLTFTRSVIFNNHMRRHEEGISIECDICGKPFYTTRQMKRHKIKHCRKIKLTQAKEFLCDYCGKYFDNYNRFYNHKKTHVKEGEFKCSQCDKIFTQRFKLRMHMKSHNTEKDYMCDICGHLSKYPEAMRKHRKRHFSVPVKVIRQRCPVCNKGFESLSRMKSHMVVHSNLQPYQCEICERRFNVLNNLKRHMLVHTGEKPFRCNFCNRGFTQSGALKLHQTSTKCRERMETLNPNKVIKRDDKYECNICGRKFKRYHWLNIHLAKHSQLDSLTCDVCGSKFSNKANLRRHLMCHTGEKPFKCELCDKTFRQKTELVVHTRRHTGEKPYKCEFCDRRFVEYGEQKRHHKRHLKQMALETMAAQEVDEKDESLVISLD